MFIKDYFIHCEEVYPEQKRNLRRLLLALRREGVKTMGELCKKQSESPEEISRIRDIGKENLKLVALVCESYEKNAVNSSVEEEKEK